MLSRNLLICLLDSSVNYGMIHRPLCRLHSFPRSRFHHDVIRHVNTQGEDWSRTRQFQRTAQRQNSTNSNLGNDGNKINNDTSSLGESYLEARRKGVLKGRRILSPLDRVSGMVMDKTESEMENRNHIPLRDTISTFVNNITNAEERDDQNNETKRIRDSNFEPDIEPHHGSSAVRTSKCHQIREQGTPLLDGEYVIITRENLKRQEKLVRLVKLDANQEFKCKFGNVEHADIIGHQSGSVFATHMDIELLIRRPSLEEYVLYMKRHPVISYPKDCCTMLMMIDASPGDVVLEAGSGSGAMTLFLSRAVGHHGRVFSFDKVPMHQVRAKKNYFHWHTSYDISHEVKWPRNVSFYPSRLQDCTQYIQDQQLDGAIIDIEGPSTVMATMAQRLKPGKSMAIYVANLTQVIDIAETIRKDRLPLVMEKTLEVAHKEWVVNPARRYGGVLLQELTTVDEQEFGNEGVIGKSKGVQYIADEVPKYLARPHHNQQSHTAFLVKIRKVQSSSSTFKV